MRQVVVRSRVTPEEAAHHDERAPQLFAELGRTAPSGIHWAMYALEDGVTFIDVATTETMDGGRSRLWKIEAFRAFQEQAR
ncbi:MAG TPA: hypothetical protein VH916_13800 [Dehalococcoidia bacterium]